MRWLIFLAVVSVSFAEVIWTDDLEDGNIDDWTITGSANWALYDNEFQAHSGDFSLEYNYLAPWPHDTRAVTPEFTLPAADEFQFTWWWSGSGTHDLYYHPSTGLVKTVYSVASYHMAESLINFNVQQQ